VYICTIFVVKYLKCEDMEEKERELEDRNFPLNNTKLTWEIPELFSLNKLKTKGGDPTGYTEDTPGMIGPS